jgi:hypothetical protein
MDSRMPANHSTLAATANRPMSAVTGSDANKGTSPTRLDDTACNSIPVGCHEEGGAG